MSIPPKAAICFVAAAFCFVVVAVQVVRGLWETLRMSWEDLDRPRRIDVLVWRPGRPDANDEDRELADEWRRRNARLLIWSFAAMAFFSLGWFYL
ncbi:MAG: hypothetical protein R3E97_17230 [Candidatus Eisenbacteria bacterium]